MWYHRKTWDILEGLLCFLDVTDQMLPPRAPNRTSLSLFPLVQKEPLWRRPQLRPAVGWFSQTAERDPKAFQGWLCSGSAWFGVTQHWLEGSPQNGHPGEYPKRFQEQGSSSSLVQGLREPLSRSFSPWHDLKKQNTCMLFYRDLFSHQCQQ